MDVSDKFYIPWQEVVVTRFKFHHKTFKEGQREILIKFGEPGANSWPSVFLKQYQLHNRHISSNGKWTLRFSSDDTRLRLLHAPLCPFSHHWPGNGGKNNVEGK
jgi:hypothetical protein